MVVRQHTSPLRNVSKLQSLDLKGSPRSTSLLLSQWRSLHTSCSRFSRPSISPTGKSQLPAYLQALSALYEEIAARYPTEDGKRPQGRTEFPPWPARGTMNQEFHVPTTRGRCSLVSMEKARDFVRGALALNEGSSRKEGRVVIEAFPGPGAVTRALLELPPSEVKRVIVVEEELKYLKYLKELEYHDDRVHVLPHSGFIWETYDEIQELGLLDDVVVEDWKAAPHSTLNFIGHLPLGPVGEQLIAQLFRAIPEQSWLFKYGRVRMSWLLAQRMLDRIQSPPKKASRCKLTVIAEATAKLSPALSDQELEDYNKLFFPKSDPTSQGKKIPLARRIGQPFVALNVDPLAESPIMRRTEANELIARAVIDPTGSKVSVPSSERAEVERIVDEGGVKELISVADAKGLIQAAGEGTGGLERVPMPVGEGTRVTLEKWDYVLRQLFVLKSTPLEKAIQNLGAGAAILLSKLTGPDVPEERRVNVKTTVNALSVRDFARIVEEFDRWPFAPDVLFIADPAEDDRN
ncbi:Mitochondrial transcription factor 1 [Ceratobasidium sp. UAMH 11750]|nr:Mitochondrial transcription factor 1 [Ceratobasidium sp. UAMH 11750]